RYQRPPGMPKAYRLIHGESDGLPGLIVDIYDKIAVVQFLALGLEPWRDAILEAIKSVVKVESIYERSDSPVRMLEGLTEKKGVVDGREPQVLEFDDNGAVIVADVVNGAKTGLFLDQLENQREAAWQAVGRDLLNCFSYTGLFGLRAALAGAKSVIDVEISA